MANEWRITPSSIETEMLRLATLIALPTHTPAMPPRLQPTHLAAAAASIERALHCIRPPAAASHRDCA